MAADPRSTRSDDVDVDPRPGPRRGSLNHGADRADHLARAADALADVLLSDAHFVGGRTPGLSLFDLPGGRVGDEVPGEIFDELAHQTGWPFSADGALVRRAV